MDYRNLGRSGLKVSSLWLGTANFGREVDAEQSYLIMDRAFEAGVTCIDTANVYTRGQSEEIVGRWIDERGYRQQIVLATKVFARTGAGPNDQGLSRRHIMEQIDASLRRLRTDYIDLYYSHSPDQATPQDETMRAFDDLVHAGKVRYLGCSNYAAWQATKALWISDKLGLYSFVCVQPRYNLLWRSAEDELLPMCADLGLGVLTYSPTAGGFLTGRYTRASTIEANTRFANVPSYKTHYWKEENFRFVDAFQAYCQKRGAGMAEMCIAWCATHPTVTAPIIGVHTLDHLEQALRAQAIKLTAEERAEIARLGSSTQ